MVAAAVVAGAAVVGAIATTSAANKSSGAVEGAAQTAAQEQQNALTQEKQLAAPYTAAGQLAIPKLEALLGLGKGGGGAIQSTLENLPGYQFTRQQGNEAAVNSASARGMNLSGNTLAELSKYNSGLANQYYGQYAGQLQRLVGTGQAAAAGQAQAGEQVASNLGNIATGQGQNLANIDIGEAAGLSNIASGAAQNYLETQANKNLLSQFNGYENFGGQPASAGFSGAPLS